MSVNITIKEGGVAKNLTADKLRTNLYGGGTCLWVPEDDVQLGTKSIDENGTYKAEDDGYYGFSQVTVNVPGGAGGPPGGKGSSVVGKKPNGNDAVITIDQNGDIVEMELPSEIRVTTPPDDTNYLDGDEIDYTGMVVKAYKADGTLWTNETYTDGVVPLNELVLPDTHADFSKVVHEQEYPEYQDSGTVIVTSVGSIREAFDDAISHFNGTVNDGGIFENYIYPKLDMYEGTNPAIISIYNNAPQGFGGYSPIDVIIFIDYEVGDEIQLGNKGVQNFYIIQFNGQGSGGTLRIVDYQAGIGHNIYHAIYTGENDSSTNFGASSINATNAHYGQQPLAVNWNRPIDGFALSTETYVTVTQGDYTSSSGDNPDPE